MDFSVSRILNAARFLLITKGWIKGQSFERGKGYCISGALAEVTSKMRSSTKKESTRQLIIDSAVSARTTLQNKCNGSITEWNDDKSRKFTQVLKILDEAILSQAKGV